MARYAGQLWAVVVLTLVPAVLAGQVPDRSRQLEARQAERLRARQAGRASAFGIDPYDAWGLDCDPYPGAGGTPWGGTPWAGGSPYGMGRWPGGPASGCAPAGWSAYPGGYGAGRGYGGYGYGGYGYGSYGYGSYGYGTGYPGYGSTGYGYGYGAYGSSPYGPGGYGYGLLPTPPNPYQDWARLWGRGWLDGEAIPPYHRFQYRFFPETLPDPTANGYVTAQEWYGSPAAGPIPTAPDCVRVELDLGGDAPEVFAVRLPALGAGTAEALQAVITNRMSRGGGVVLRAYDGHVVRLPPFESIRALTVAPCAAAGGR